MTKKELADMLSYSDSTIKTAISQAKKVMPSILQKTTYDCFEEISYTVEEIECICRCIIPPLNEIQIELIKDNYIKHDVTYIQKRQIWMDGTEEFAERVKKDRHVKACANCLYCCGKSKKGTSARKTPYCKFYNKFIRNIKIDYKHKDWNNVVREYTRSANIFTDKCESWQRGEVNYFKK